MMRRSFIMLLCGAAAYAFPIAPSAQQSAKLRRIGLMRWKAEGCISSDFEDALHDLGYTPGKDLVIECRDAGAQYSGLNSAAAALVALKVDVIAALSEPAAHAAQSATATIPIVMIASGDPVASGLVKSLARPGGNVTGLSYYATELTAKRLEILKEIVPAARRVAVLTNPEVSYLPFVRDTKREADALGVETQVFEASDAAGIDAAFEAIDGAHFDALFILPDLMSSVEGSRIAKLALARRLPTVAWGSWFPAQGCLAAYSADYDALERRAATYVDKILRGASPADLPVEQPTAFRLIFNVKTAKQLGLTIPPSLLARADEVIE
jgi:putative ABC transport system substrate-binding protein